MRFSSSEPAAANASTAPMVSTGPMPNAIDAEFHISMQAALTACGSAWPPHCSGAGDRVPAGGGPGGVRLFQPGGMVIRPSLNGVPCRSPAALSGASTSLANRPASCRMASMSEFGEVAVSTQARAVLEARMRCRQPGRGRSCGDIRGRTRLKQKSFGTGRAENSVHLSPCGRGRIAKRSG